MKWRRARPLAEELSLSRIFRSAHPPAPRSRVCFYRPLVSLINSLTSSHFCWQKKRAQGAGTWILVDAPRARPAAARGNRPDSGKGYYPLTPVSGVAESGDGRLSLCRFFTAAVWCVPALRVPLVHSLINHFRQKYASVRERENSFAHLAFSLSRTMLRSQFN